MGALEGACKSFSQHMRNDRSPAYRPSSRIQHFSPLRFAIDKLGSSVGGGLLSRELLIISRDISIWMRYEQTKEKLSRSAFNLPL